MMQPLQYVAGLMAMTSAVVGCSNATQESSYADPSEVHVIDAPSLELSGPANTITCTYPVMPDDTADTIFERFGTNARRENLENEGGLYPVVALWPDDQARRLEATFVDDDPRGKVRAVRIAGVTPEWNIAGIRHGTKLEELEHRNGRPFEFYGFEWDFGGMVFDWKGGALAMLDGGCGVGASIGDKYDSGEILPDELVGDRAVSSDLASLRTMNVEVFDLWIRYP